MLYVEHYRTVSFAYLILRILDRPILVSYPDGIMHDTSHAKGKASTAQQTCLGSLLGLELN